MEINSPIDSNAIALDLKNFGILPPHLSKVWMTNLATVSNSKLAHPHKAIIELINSCNLDCPMCRVGQFGVNQRRVLPLNTFEHILSQIKGLKKVRLNGLGESTLLDDLSKYLDAIEKRGITTELITNGSGAIEAYLRILNGGGWVVISWDAAEKKIFEKLRKPAQWEQYTENLKRLCEAAGDSRKKISLLFTLQKSNVDQLVKLVEQCHEWKIDHLIVNVVKLGGDTWEKELLLQVEKEFEEAMNLAIKHHVSLFLPNQVMGYRMSTLGAFPTHEDFCRLPWEEVVIRWNGDVQVCNMFNPYVYGNVHLNTFDEIWNNMFANLFRKMIRSNDKHPYCQNCVYFEDAYKH